MRKFFRSILLVLLCLPGAFDGAEIHVAKNGRDNGSGSQTDPLLTINRAAFLAQPGDIVIIHTGTYRERVRPQRGGTDQNNRIIYRAAENEDVYIKGSERITSWSNEGSGVWRTDLPNSFFGNFNPYALQITGGYLNYGGWHHRGDVYLNGEAYTEQRNRNDIDSRTGRWYCHVNDNTTSIWANFGDKNPNNELAEINVRRSIFMPAKNGLGYITIDGLHFAHAATNWAPPNAKPQDGAIHVMFGKRWIIRNCMITNSRCVGISLGQSDGEGSYDWNDIDSFGDHLIENNHIRGCGEAGIAGVGGASRSTINHNLIEDTNIREEFGGYETAAIKFHCTIDCVISNNLIRGVYEPNGVDASDADGIWIDWENQGIRITGNIILDTDDRTLWLEMNHGPILVDNNIIIGDRIWGSSSSLVIAHNLIIDAGYNYYPFPNRSSKYWVPHTRQLMGRRAGLARDNKWYNNIYVNIGMEGNTRQEGFESDYNVFYGGAKKDPFGNEHSVVSSFKPDVSMNHTPTGVTISFTVDETPFSVSSPIVNGALVGTFSITGQTIEDEDRNPITVDRDINGAAFDPVIPGPLATLKQGKNVITWSLAVQ